MGQRVRVRLCSEAQTVKREALLRGEKFRLGASLARATVTDAPSRDTPNSTYTLTT